MYKNILEKINNYADEKYGKSIYHPSVTDVELEKFKNTCQSKLNYNPVDSYIDFLKISNGYDWNGLQIYGTERKSDSPVEGFIEANQDFMEENETDKYIVFASSGVEKYVFYLMQQEYLIIDAFSLDEFEKVDSFDNLISTALNNNS